MVLPNSHSFLLIRRTVVEPSLAPETEHVVATALQSADLEQPNVKDRDKRNFLRVAGIAAAAGIIALVSPRKAQALILGSSPTTGVVGVKDSADARINPATEETVSSLATEATVSTLATEATVAPLADLTFDTGSLQVKVTSLPTDPLQVDVVSSELPTAASTETTLETVSFGGVQFALRLATDTGDSNIDYVGEAAVGTLNSEGGWRIKRINSTSGIVIEWANGTEGFDVSHIWNNRESLTYS
ncbi:MAG: hypothetical protein A3B24_02680 [Candidatus Wildermuthbacteria bacterium RIFCSPLOWO2_01_FULL_48_16]|uniref:Uncharacterized protein n=1 Tax=Candidatus Wildermuthbacteria bacterium RIFCSPLOWO2_01_FULL_48_16 TaxID=1802461 RepID=A0A1G2RJC3_9BACT|nr:MAG: hypothetical protein A3B24_02680 [Candidatus Wildermuthbacteria bacterium RIFCSPLOWO2_01_FULL_48_16]